MEPPSPARLYATVVGAVLVVLGIVGFFYDASFTALDDLEPALGALEVNAWFNLLYLATGAIGVLVAGVSSRRYSLTMGFLFTLLGIFALGTRWLHLTIGLLGFVAVAATAKTGEPRREGGPGGVSRTLSPKGVRETPPGPASSEPRAKTAGERA